MAEVRRAVLAGGQGLMRVFLLTRPLRSHASNDAAEMAVGLVKGLTTDCDTIHGCECSDIGHTNRACEVVVGEDGNHRGRLQRGGAEGHRG